MTKPFLICMSLLLYVSEEPVIERGMIMLLMREALTHMIEGCILMALSTTKSSITIMTMLGEVVRSCTPDETGVPSLPSETEIWGSYKDVQDTRQILFLFLGALHLLKGKRDALP